MRRPSKLESATRRNIAVRFIKDYKKPQNEGGRLIPKGYVSYMNQREAEYYIKTLGVAEAAIQPKAIVSDEEE